jgi:hypothetical protein
VLIHATACGEDAVFDHLGFRISEQSKFVEFVDHLREIGIDGEYPPAIGRGIDPAHRRESLRHVLHFDRAHEIDGGRLISGIRPFGHVRAKQAPHRLEL